MSPVPAPFPPHFVWGVATSAYQIEGGIDLDGRGPSIWDRFCETPGRIRNGDRGDVAADHRRRMAEDVALLAELGYPAYRFSVAWPRVQPDGERHISAAGIDFYRALVDALLAHGIEPIVTLYHWDLPQSLEDRGGWPARETAERFGAYAEIVGRALGDRVRRWSTVNEPWCAAMLGYAHGVHAPGRTDAGAAMAAAHHLLLGHGLAVDALRAVVRGDSEIGLTLNPYPVVPVSDREEDHDAARRVDGLANRLWYDAVLHGRYPGDVLHDVRTVTDLRHVRDGDLAIIARPIDAHGLNYYRRYHVGHAPRASADPPAWPGSPDIAFYAPPSATTAAGWAIEPHGLTEALVRLAAQWPAPPLYIHENGAAFADTPAPNGSFDDRDRIAYLDRHVRAASDAIRAGVDLRGYLVWSFLDNFEWAEGYTLRFGLVHVDFATQHRTPKASARWFGQLASARC
ncbi:MAG TPA: GH1 family beta-glucosidase [Acidimicrobiales bacterium]|nr:GH1 family beta-glucosidase [Acidimicrobiales bacterium]